MWPAFLKQGVNSNNFKFLGDIYIGFVTFVSTCISTLVFNSWMGRVLNVKKILREVDMTPTLMHRFWTFVEKTQSKDILGLNDADLTQWLVGRFTDQQNLSHTQMSSVRDYIKARLSLIRELAERRGGVCPSMA
jgi:hypothetical protein